MMRIRSWTRAAMAAGVMLVSGGCTADALAPVPPPAPRVASIGDVLAGKSEVARISETAANRGVEGTRIRICHRAGLLGPEPPLFVVDGKEIAHDDAHHRIDPDRIESIEVLKGPSATARYGPRAANGVVVIHMKRQ